jgi:hypothetical protein
MLRRILLSSTIFVVAVVILGVSVFQSSSISYALSVATPSPKAVIEARPSEIDYTFVYPGKVLPDNPLWSLKALRDKILYLITSNSLKKAERVLLYSDKRLLASQELFRKNKPDIALSTLSKGEKYLEIATSQEGIARQNGIDTKDFLVKLANASLKHRQVIEEMMSLVPEDGKPNVVRSLDYSKDSYKYSRDGLNSMGAVGPINPFDGNK